MDEKEEGKVPAGIANELEKFAKLLDPHLSTSTEVKEPANPKQWSALKAAVYISGTSLVVGALILALVYYLLWR